MKNILSIRYFRGIAGAILLVVIVVIAVGAVRIPGAHADAPSCRYIVTADDTVFDQDTSLTWQRHPDDVVRTWDDAVSYCTNLTVAGGGWRLPTQAELNTLIDEARENPAIDQTAFPSTASDFFWSSQDANDSTSAWKLEFGVGTSYTTAKSEGNRVRCVR